jgi:hypothetical protein
MLLRILKNTCGDKSMIQDKSFSRRLALNHAILKNKYWRLPVDNVGHENYVPVGRGSPTSEVCGRWVGFDVCTDIVGHEGIFIEGVDCTGKHILRHQHLWCHSAQCPVCFNRGWSVRGGMNVEARVKTAEKRGLGSAEHISVNLPEKYWELPEHVQRGIAKKALLDRGVTWGCEIFHGFRPAKDGSRLVWNCHYHTLSHAPMLQKCRECHKICSENKDCDGFVNHNYRTFEKDGIIVKVHGKRKTIFGTAFYELNHSTVHVGLKRTHVVSWFGLVSNRKFRTDRSMAKSVCPACEEEMQRGSYVGKEWFAKNVGDPLYRPWIAVDPLDEDGEPNTIVWVGGSGSYER